MKGISADGDDGEDGFHEAGGGGQWGDDDDDLFDDEDDGGGKKNKKKGGAGGAGGEEGEKKKGWGEDDLDLSDDDDAEVATGGSPRTGKSSGDGFGGSFFTPPSGGTSPTVTWCADSSHAADHLAAGSAESALQLLHRQIAMVNASPLRVNALSLYLGATAYLPGLPLVPPNRSYLVRESTAGPKAGTIKSMPQLALKVPPLTRFIFIVSTYQLTESIPFYHFSMFSFLSSFCVISISRCQRCWSS